MVSPVAAGLGEYERAAMSSSTDVDELRHHHLLAEAGLRARGGGGGEISQLIFDVLSCGLRAPPPQAPPLSALARLFLSRGIWSFFSFTFTRTHIICTGSRSSLPPARTLGDTLGGDEWTRAPGRRAVTPRPWHTGSRGGEPQKSKPYIHCTTAHGDVAITN